MLQVAPENGLVNKTIKTDLLGIFTSQGDQPQELT